MNEFLDIFNEDHGRMEIVNLARVTRISSIPGDAGCVIHFGPGDFFTSDRGFVDLAALLGRAGLTVAAG